MNKSFVRIEFTEDSGIGVSRLAAESETTAEDLRACDIGEDIGSALERCGAPRVLLILATAVQRIMHVEPTHEGILETETDKFVKAADRLIESWREFDSGLNGRGEIIGQPRF